MTAPTVDEFTVAESPDFRRDRWGRPHIMQLDGKRIGYTRCSSAAKTIEDTFNLEMWARRNVAYGMAHDGSLVARVLAAGGDPSTWDKSTKDQIASVVTDAEQVAKAHKAADIGTAVHRLTEMMDRGGKVTGGPYQADLDAYAHTLASACFTVDPRYVECRIVNDDLQMAGTADRILINQHGRHIVADLKTSASVDFGGLGWGAQLATYAGGTLYDVDAEQRVDTPTLDLEVGLIIHLPAGRGECTLYEIDLVAGLEAAHLANQIRATRKDSKKWIRPLTIVAPSLPLATSSSAEGVGLTVPAPSELSGRDRLLAATDARREALLARYRLLNEGQQIDFRLSQPDPHDLDAVELALDAVEPFATVIPPVIPPVTPPRVTPQRFIGDEGDRADDDAVAELTTQGRALAKEDISHISAVAKQAAETVGSISMRTEQTVRRYELTRALIHIAQFGWSEDIVRDLVAAVTDDHGARQPAVSLGLAVGMLDLTEATAFADLASRLARGSVLPVVPEGGDRFRFVDAA